MKKIRVFTHAFTHSCGVFWRAFSQSLVQQVRQIIQAARETKDAPRWSRATFTSVALVALYSGIDGLLLGASQWGAAGLWFIGDLIIIANVYVNVRTDILNALIRQLEERQREIALARLTHQITQSRWS